MQIEPSLSSPATVEFHGPSEASLFTREVTESLAGILRHNFCGRFDGANAGFLHSSIGGRPWENTMWVRDAMVMLREFVHWGHLDEAVLLAEALMTMIRPNEEGFHSYPEYFRIGEPASGTELDGTTGVIIALCLLWGRLPAEHASRTRIFDFLNAPASPVRWIESVTTQRPLVAGSGEFGGGCGIPGLYCNVVQNALCRLALLAAAEMMAAAGDEATAENWRTTACKLEDAITQHLIGPDGTWIWCVDPETLQPDPELINHPINKGFGGLNGVACMQSDVLGLDPRDDRWFGVETARATFDKLLNTPKRRAQFEKHGIWTQFDDPPLHLMTSPSYGHAYALQNMLLFDRTDLAAQALRFLAHYTYNPPKRYHLDRESAYWFFERCVSPDEENPDIWDQACGALNVVNVGEPLKAGRLILGLDDSRPAELALIPRLPEGWVGYEARNWPVRTAAGPVRLDIDCRRDAETLRVSCRVRHGARLAKLRVRCGDQSRQAENVGEYTAEFAV